MAHRTALIATLGCRLNQADSALLTDRLRRAGFVILEEGASETPSLVIVNSCSVTAAAAAKSRQAARRFRRLYPGTPVILTGCSAELDYGRARVAPDGVVLLSNPEKRDLERRIEELLGGNVPREPVALSRDAGAAVFRENAFGRFPFRTFLVPLFTSL